MSGQVLPETLRSNEGCKVPQRLDCVLESVIRTQSGKSVRIAILSTLERRSDAEEHGESYNQRHQCRDP